MFFKRYVPAPAQGTGAAKPEQKRNHRHRHLKGRTVFVVVMLAYPVAQFLITWLGVNINSLLLAFEVPVRGVMTWVPADDIFYNFTTLFESFKSPQTQSMFLASLAYFVVSCLVTLPLSLFFSYFVFKKVVMSDFFKVIFYLPSILPLVILTLVYALSFDPKGFMTALLGFFGIPNNGLLIGTTAKWMVWIFCIWAGIGYNVILLTAGMSRIPREVLESVKMDGCGPFREFAQVIVPLTWPTVTTLFLFGMMSVFNVFLQPFFLTAGQYDTMTIGLRIYQASRGPGLNDPATLGLFCSVIGTPFILLARWGLNRAFGDINF